MQKALFLEYKFGDYEKDTLEQSGATAVIAWIDGLTKDRMTQLQSTGMNIDICIQAFDPKECPANPEQKLKCKEKIQQAIEFHPASIWLDHFRFGGYWETKTGTILDIHKPCMHCQKINRATFLADFAEIIKKTIPVNILLNYFAIPFKPEERPDITTILGQDHAKLGKIFDCISPMLYHRMIDKRIDYISKYVSWIAMTTQKPILPILQVKDMPDTLPDLLAQEEMKKAYEEAKKYPAIGVAWFSWDGAVEKNKTTIVSELFKE